MGAARTGRRRPRKRSVSFHRLWWVMRREALAQLVMALLGEDQVVVVRRVVVELAVPANPRRVAGKLRALSRGK